MAYRTGYPLARLWWRLRGKHHEGALVAIYVGDALLLLRSSYRQEWNMPGGGVRPGEEPRAAAEREVQEEIGFSPAGLVAVGTVSGQWNGRHEEVHLFQLHLSRLPALRLDNREITGSQLFPPHGLPRVTGAVSACLGLARQQAT